ncbi:MAG: fumarylacetoacetate hydrolase family protein [Candidatus Dormibacteraeota bacterium]|uniref:Fumarylacetoacetate hydrolase family protein n=1 Tax=Candidatus Aeolococcus gillhamiae TaxID=3127015 RepID=A0A934JPT4_9BACT|nr:fumarylacetoacetate hydrolase family protein [Candidatus Dormibacteraeota bacterium]
MKLLMFRDRGARRLGVGRDAESDQVVDVAAAAGGDSMPADILGVIDGGEAVLDRLRELASSASGEAVRRIADLELLAPFDPPRGNVLCIGRNYQAHAEESARANQTEVGPPTIFTKAISSITDPYGDIPINPAVSTKIDWEVELGVVIGSTGSNIKRVNALEHVFGYTVVNDVTARDIQNGWGGQWFKGKSLDGSCPVGPWVLTKDEVDDVQSLQVQLRVNGVVKQDANTRDMIYPVDAIIEWLSVGMTLRPGMLIATGTPEGVGFARTPPEFLTAGDVMETEVMGVGLLRNTVVELPS